MIQLTNLTLTFGQRHIFDHVSFVFEQYKYGFVGRNGAGKSTLLKILARELQADSGTITVARGKRIAYLPQELTFTSERTIFDEACTVFQEQLALQQEQIALERQLEEAQNSTAEQLIERYLTILERTKSIDIQELHKRARTILIGLGIDESMHNNLVQSLSLGWRMRLLLAKLLLQDADFYLFDEPTNHLDIVGKEWFFEFLKTFGGGFLLVTHDRYFLDGVCERIVEVERGQLDLYVGNFTTYVRQKEEHLITQRAAYERQQRELEKKQATIDRFRAGTKSKMAQSMLKQLEKIERIEIEPPLPTITVPKIAITRSAATVLTLKKISFGYMPEKMLFKNIDLEIMRGQKVALIAPNGVGKTTLFNIVAGSLKPTTGSVVIGQMVTCALFAQDQTAVLKIGNTVFEEVSSAVDVPEKAVRAMLGAFLFTGDDAHKKISMLSGGEKNRVAMAKVFLKKANFLLLDEPTNHLDLYAKEILAQALIQYEGTIFFVSHDQDFINKVATRIVELSPHGLFTFEGTYEGYMWMKNNLATTDQKSAPADKKQQQKQEDSHISKNDAHKKITKLEKQIEKLEHDIAKVGEKMTGLSFHDAEYKVLIVSMNEMKQKLDDLVNQWDQLSA